MSKYLQAPGTHREQSLEGDDGPARVALEALKAKAPNITRLLAVLVKCLWPERGMEQRQARSRRILSVWNILVSAQHAVAARDLHGVAASEEGFELLLPALGALRGAQHDPQLAP